MNARQVIRGHADITVPDMVERDPADLRPEALQAFGPARLQPGSVVAGSDYRAAGNEPVACIVTREIQFAMSVRHRLPTGNDGLANIVRQRLRRHLPGLYRHHLTRNV